MGRSAPERMEIIELGAGLLASKRGPIQKEFSSLVRPVKRPTLSAFCMGLTGIQQHEIDEVEDLQGPSALPEMDRAATLPAGFMERV